MGRPRKLETETLYLPPTEHVYVPKRSGELCLFWSRDQDDALALVAGLCLTDKWPTVKRIHEAATLLDQHDDEGARRLAARLRNRTLAPEGYMGSHIPIPEVAYARNERKSYPCAWKTHPLANATCRHGGRYAVPGIRGTFCAVHARYAAGKAKRKERRSKSATGGSSMIPQPGGV
jgi:hypothetical protein